MTSRDCSHLRGLEAGPHWEVFRGCGLRAWVGGARAGGGASVEPCSDASEGAGLGRRDPNAGPSGAGEAPGAAAITRVK